MVVRLLDELAASWHLPPLGYAQLVEILSSDPVSYVRATPRSVAVRFPECEDVAGHSGRLAHGRVRVSCTTASMTPPFCSTLISR